MEVWGSLRTGSRVPVLGSRVLNVRAWIIVLKCNGYNIVYSQQYAVLQAVKRCDQIITELVLYINVVKLALRHSDTLQLDDELDITMTNISKVWRTSSRYEPVMCNV